MRAWMMKLFGRTPPGGIDCHQVARTLQRYLDGHIDAERAQRIAAHLEDCRRCGMEAETYQRIKAALAAHRPDVPADSLRRLREFAERLASGGEPSTT